MATDDIQVLVAGTAPAPAHFTVPGSGQITPRAIFATYDGTGAAATFQPALKIISDGGETVGIYPTAVSIAAGGSADVSWFPRVSGGAIPSPGSILQTYHALPAAVGFPFNSAALTHSNWPANPNYFKVSGTSLLFFSLNCDVDPGGTPDTIELLLLVDGISISNLAIGIANTNITTFSWPRVFVTGIGFPNGIPAGPHTFNLGVETFNNQNCNLRSNGSCDLQVIEYEANIVS